MLYMILDEYLYLHWDNLSILRSEISNYFFKVSWAVTYITSDVMIIACV